MFLFVSLSNINPSFLFSFSLFLSLSLSLSLCFSLLFSFSIDFKSELRGMEKVGGANRMPDRNDNSWNYHWIDMTLHFCLSSSNVLDYSSNFAFVSVLTPCVLYHRSKTARWKIIIIIIIIIMIGKKRGEGGKWKFIAIIRLSSQISFLSRFFFLLFCFVEKNWWKIEFEMWGRQTSNNK